MARSDPVPSREIQRITASDVQVPRRCRDRALAEKVAHRLDVLGLVVDERRECPPQAVRAVVVWIETDAARPTFYQFPILIRGEPVTVWFATAGEEKVILTLARLADPGGERCPRVIVQLDR